MKFKSIAALFGLSIGMVVALPGAAVAQSSNSNLDNQTYEQDAKPSPNVPMAGPRDPGFNSSNQVSNNQGSDQDSADQYSGPMDPGALDSNSNDSNSNDPNLNGSNSSNSNSSNPNSNDPSYNTPAPEEKNGVARISLIHGDVSTQRGDSRDWSAAALNAPVVAGDRVSTGDKARTEIQLDYANMFRLAEHTQANITQLTKSQIQIQLGHGMANYTVYKNSDADAEIDTPNVAIRTQRNESSFRILVTADDHTEVLVRKGEIEVTTPQGGTRVGQGQYITIQGSGADEQYKIGEAPARDDWDQWNTDRDNMIRNSASRRHTNDYYVGTEDLDSHGTWSEVPDYGQVWRPNVSPGWAPYRDGRWVYEPYWGWTWVSSDSWGWAPYHYGRWMEINGGWGWWPGPAYGYPFYRPIWAPAYVSFFGFGGGFGVGFGAGFGGWGSIGWLPLGPCDRFHPWYGRFGGRFGATRFGELNRGGFAALHGGNRFSNVNLAMRDRNFRGASSVSGHDFGTGRMRAQALGHSQLQNAHFTTGRLPVNPGRESFSASGRAGAASTTHVSQNQHFFSARGGNATATATHSRGGENGRFGSNGGFDRSNQNSGRNSGRSSERSSAMRGNSNSASGAERGNSGGWQKFSQMPPRSSSGSGRSSAEQGRPGNYSQGGRDQRGDQRSDQRGSSGNYGQSRGPASEGRGYGSSRSYGGGYSRPQLNMRQPIVTQRSYGGPYGGGGYSGRSAPSYSGPRSAPSYGGGHSAPSYGGGGGGHSAPSSHGGGGGAPHGGGGSSRGGSSHGGSSHGGGGGRHGR